MNLAKFTVTLLIALGFSTAFAGDGPHCGKEFKDAKQACKDANSTNEVFIDCIKDAWSARLDCRQGRLDCKDNFVTDQRSCLEDNADLNGVRNCFKDARTTKKDCIESGGPVDNGQCVADCDATRDASHATCEADNNVDDCGGDPICEADTQAALSSCLATADADHAVCIQACDAE